jgi:predicted RNase H-like HicB family nuclease
MLGSSDHRDRSRAGWKSKLEKGLKPDGHAKLLISGPSATVSIMTSTLKIVIEQHPDGFVAYPLGVNGVIVGQGDTKEAALEDVQSAIAFHLETFGPHSLELLVA